MRITLLTASSESYWPLMEMTLPNKTEYCLRHKYQLAAKVHYKVEPYMVEREKYMLEELYHCEWLFFMGSDTLITNMTIPLESVIMTVGKDADFVVGVDVNGINNDVLLIRNSVASAEFLRRVIYAKGRFPNDQAGMAAVFGEMPEYKVKKVHQKIFNAMPYWLYGYPDHKGGMWTQGDFVFHCPGLSMDARLAVTTEILPKTIR